MATIGLFKIPFGFEVVQSDRDRLFLERSTAEHGLFPGEYDAGVRLQGGWRFVRYAVAVMNGEPIGEKTGFPLRDPNSAKDVVGPGRHRHARSRRCVWVAGGFSGLCGNRVPPRHARHEGDRAVGTTPTATACVSARRDHGRPRIAAATPRRTSRASATAPTCGSVSTVPSLGATVLWSELYWAKNLDRGVLPADPVAFGRDYREFGLYVALTQELGPARAGRASATTSTTRTPTR